MRVSFRTRSGKRISFATHKGSRRRRSRASAAPGPMFRPGKMLPRRKGMKKGQIVRVRGHRGAYMVMKSGLKPVRA